MFHKNIKSRATSHVALSTVEKRNRLKMTLWSSPHPKESTALSLGQAQQSSEVVKIKDLTDPGTIMPASATSFASDGSEDAGFEDGSIDVDMGEEEAEGIQIDCIQTLTEFEPAEGDLNGVDNGNTSMAGSKTPIPLPPPPMQLGSGSKLKFLR